MAHIRELIRHKNPSCIPSDWKYVELGEIGNLLSGLTYSPDNIYENGTLVLRSSNINNGFLEFDDNVYVDTTTLKFKPVEEGDILICVRNGSKSLIGKNALVTEVAEGMAFGAFMALFRSEHNQFLTHLFNTDLYKSQIHRNLGATINSINGSDFKKFHFPFPPDEERKKIADILNTWNQAISTTQKLIDKLKLRNIGLAQQLLTGKKRLKGFEGEWQEVTLKDIADRITRKNEEIDDTVVTISAQRGFVLQEDFFTKRVASETLSNYYLIRNGEFAYNKSYSNGYPMGAFKRLDDFAKAVVTTLYICFSLKNNVNSNFMKYFFEAGLMIRPLMKIAQEGGRAHGLLNIGIHDFFGLKLRIPSLEEQEAINLVLSIADKELKLYKQQLDALKEQKKGLMQKLLTGEIRVNTKEN